MLEQHTRNTADTFVVVLQLHFNLLAIRDDPLPRLQAQVAEAQSKGQSDWAATLLEQISHENEKRDRWAVSFFCCTFASVHVRRLIFIPHSFLFRLEHTLPSSSRTRFGDTITLRQYMPFCLRWLRQRFLMVQSTMQRPR